MTAITTQTNYILNGQDIAADAKNWLTRDQFLGVYPSLSGGVGRSGIYTFGSYGSSGGLLFGDGYSSLIDPNALSTNTPVEPRYRPGGWIQSAIGGGHNGGIDKYNHLWLWGFNGTHAISPFAGNKSFPVQVNIYGETNTKWSFVCIPDIWNFNQNGGADGTTPLTLAIHAETKQLYSWGKNQNWLLGQKEGATGTIIYSPSPVGLTNLKFKSVSGGQFGILGIREDGRLLSWGRGTSGGLTYPVTGSTFARSSPALVASTIKWKQVCCGYAHAAGITEDGALYNWGYNGVYGLLGLNETTTGGSSLPVLVGGSTKKWRQVSCGYYFTAALDIEGNLYTWGFGGYGSLGHGSFEHVSSPTLVNSNRKWFRVNCSRNATHMISTAGELFSMGLNYGNERYASTSTSYHYTSYPEQIWVYGSGKWLSLSEGGYNLFSGLMLNAEDNFNGTIYVTEYNSQAGYF